MKRIIAFIILICMMLGGCTQVTAPAQVAATTLPVWEFTARLCQGTGITVARLVTENVSCLHDYTLQVSQMRQIESAELVVINGAGMEEFLEDALNDVAHVLDASTDIELHCGDEEADDRAHEHEHQHAEDPHIWLSPILAIQMATNIYEGLCSRYPEHQQIFQNNLTILIADLQALQTYGETTLSTLSHRELITFHDGFTYFAESFGLTILESVEEESGSEASAAELIRLIRIVQDSQLPAIFTETNGSASAAAIIAAETGINKYILDMVMAGDSYFDAMYRNINTIKEALG